MCPFGVSGSQTLWGMSVPLGSSVYLSFWDIFVSITFGGSVAVSEVVRVSTSLGESLCLPLEGGWNQ